MRTRIAWIFLLGTLVTAGCQKSTGPLTPVNGRITHRGYALPGGTVVFAPDASRGEAGPVVYAKIRSDGTYSLQTGDSPGAPAGWYRVTVTCLGPAMTQTGSPFHIPQSYIPDKYRDPNQSQLACEVKPDRVNAIDFNLD